MSYAIDRSRAIALERRDGSWSLELEQLIRINRNTFRPRRQLVSGVDAILQHLGAHEETLVDPTRRVLESPGQGEGRFEWHATGWVATPQAHPEAGSMKQGLAPDAGAVKTLVKEVVDLRARVEVLERQLAAFERRGVAPGIEGDVPGAADVEDEGSAPAAAAAEEAGAPEADAPPQTQPLSMPALDAVADLIKGLVGDEVQVMASDADWSLAEPQQSYVAPLNADGGEPLGALVMDLEATIRLAGGMLMEPSEELDVQVEECAPSEDILDAAGEVLNTLTSAVNKVKGNAHVRAGPLEPFDLDAHGWMGAARSRQNFACSIGGRFTVLGR